ncbi:MAG: helix-turn-helix domain-containing protein [Candidatus Helarchaeota archaeon]
MTQVMIAKFEITLPQELWVAVLSKKYPDITIEIMAMLPTADMVGNALFKLKGQNLEKIVNEIRAHPSLIELYLISDNNTSKILNIKTKDPWLLISLLKSEVILKLPVIIQNGIATWEVLAPHEKIRKFNNLLSQNNIEFQLKSLKKYKQEPQLTARQTEVLDMAVTLGYYEIPRKITLTELANRLNIAKSTLSGILRRIDKRLLQIES